MYRVSFLDRYVIEFITGQSGTKTIKGMRWCILNSCLGPVLRSPSFLVHVNHSGSKGGLGGLHQDGPLDRAVPARAQRRAMARGFSPVRFLVLLPSLRLPGYKLQWQRGSLGARRGQRDVHDRRQQSRHHILQQNTGGLYSSAVTATARNYIYESGPTYTKWAMNNGGRNIYRPAFGGGGAPYDQPDNFGSSIAMMWYRGNPSNDGADDVCFRACCTFEQRDRDVAANNYRYLGGLEVP